MFWSLLGGVRSPLSIDLAIVPLPTTGSPTQNPVQWPLRLPLTYTLTQSLTL